MDLNITKLANLDAGKSKEFLSRVDSKLMMDISKSQIVENDEWIEMVEFTIPYIEKALTKGIKNIVTEEEIIKIELIKKVTVESVKHLSKNVNFVDKYNQRSGEVIPKKILNAYKEETFITYENRFLYTLIKLIEDYMYLREKDQENEYKGKNYQKANYQAEVKLRKEKVKESIIAIGQELIKRADDITNDIKFVANIEISAKLTPDEVTNFNIKKNYIATYEDKGEK